MNFIYEYSKEGKTIAAVANDLNMCVSNIQHHIGSNLNPKSPNTKISELGFKALLLEYKFNKIGLSIDDFLDQESVKGLALLNHLKAKVQILDQHSDILKL